MKRVLGVDLGMGDDPLAAQWAQRFGTTEPEYLRVLGLLPDDAAKLRAVMGYATEQAAAGQFGKAIGALDRLDTMLASASRAASGLSGYAGLAAYRKSLLDFRSAKTRVDGQIMSLKATIPAGMPEEQELAVELAETLNDYTGDVLKAVDDAISVAADDTSPITDKIIEEIDRFAAELASNELVKHVDGNPFGVKITIASSLGECLSAIRAAMPTLAR